MQARRLHPWDVPYAEAVGIQEMLRERLILEGGPAPEAIRIVAGADISYAMKSDLFFAVVLLFSYPEMEVIEEASAVASVCFPYIPGLLSFREGPVLMEAFERLSRTPDVILFDGQGIAHPRGIGLASHMGLLLDTPAIGCAKSRLVGDYDQTQSTPGAWSSLIYRDIPVGTVLRTKKNVKPVFVSPGHRIGIDRAREITLCCCRGYRLPEPTRQAHLAVNRLRQAGAIR